MYLLLELIKNIVWVFLAVIELAMLIRALMSWFVMDDNGFVTFLHAITEPFIFPIRKLFEKMNWFQNTPLDIPFFVTFLLLSVLTSVLP